VNFDKSSCNVRINAFSLVDLGNGPTMSMNIFSKGRDAVVVTTIGSLIVRLVVALCHNQNPYVSGFHGLAVV